MIAAFNHVRELGFNPQQMLVLEGVDIDYKACCMSYVQLALLGANAVIRQRDGLAPNSVLDIDTWFTPFYILGAWEQKQKYGIQGRAKGLDFRSDDSGQLGFVV